MSTSNKIKARPGIRILFLLFVLMLSASLVAVGYHEKKNRDQWRDIQNTYHQRYISRLEDNVKQARQAGNADDLDRFSRMLVEAKTLPDKMSAVFLPGAQARDMCMSCHQAMENNLFKDDPNPLKAHPADILKSHPISNFGCTLCHHGQGVGLSVQKAHGFEANWESPRLPMKFAQSTCFECHENVVGLKGAEQAAAGKALFIDKGCYGCHDARVQADLPKFSTPFNVISLKIVSKKWLGKWIEQPAKLRPTTLMPQFRISEDQVADLVTYLDTIEDKNIDLRLKDDGKGSVEKGRTLFTEKACIACHSEKANALGISRRVPLLSDTGLKIKGDYLVNWISNPTSINPNTWMPKLELTNEDISDLTAYLKTLKNDEAKAYLSTGSIPDGNSEKGQELLQRLGCLGCHVIRGKAEPSKVGIAVGDVADKRLEELPFGNSTVAHTKWDWLYNKINDPAIYKTEDMPMAMPNFNLSTEEVEQLTVFYLFNRLRKLPEHYLVREKSSQVLGEKGQWMLSHYNCRGCHAILAEEKPRIDEFLSKKSMVPPRIVDETEKVQPAWLYNYLNRPFAMRPWLAIRMPLFNLSYEDKATLIRLLHSLMSPEKQKAITIPYETVLTKSDYTQETLDMGEYRFRNDKCMQCHPVSFTGQLPEGKNLEDLSINLMTSKSRLRFEWVKNFLRNPDQYAGAGTKMPFVFYTPDKVPRIPDPEEWIQRTSLFLMFMEKVPEPMKTEETTREVKSFNFDSY